MSKFLTFEKTETEIKVKNKKGIYLGYIYFYRQWKKWIYEPACGTFYDSQCMKDIFEYMAMLKYD